MGKLRQYHPSLKVSQIKELPKGDFLVIGDIYKVKQTGENVKVSLPKAFETNRTQNKGLAIKGVPTDITDEEFQEFLDLIKINYAKADCLKGKKMVGSYQSFNSKLMILPKPRLLFPKI